MRTRFAALLALAALAACKTAQPGVHGESSPSMTRIAGGTANEQVLYEFITRPDTRVYADAIAAPEDRVWSVLPGMLQGFGLAITRVDEARRMLGSQAAIPRGRRILGLRMSDILQCGRTPAGNPAAESYDVTLAVYTDLEPASGTTTIKTLVEGRARDSISNNPAVNCTSTGKLERAIADEARLRAAG
jgi:hypothetical protein